MDCGARSCTESSKWRYAEPRLRTHGFEVDPAECDRMNQLSHQRGLKQRFYPICLGRRNEDNRPFFITRNIYASSLLRPLTGLERLRYERDSANLADVLTVQKEIRVSTKTLDTWAEENQSPDIDFIKLDLQGAELE